MLGHSVVSDSLQPHGLSPTKLLCPWNFQARILKWVAFPTPVDLPHPGTEPASPASSALVGRFFTPEPPGKPVLVIASIICNLLLFSFREFGGNGQVKEIANLDEVMRSSEDFGLL